MLSPSLCICLFYIENELLQQGCKHDADSKLILRTKNLVLALIPPTEVKKLYAKLSKIIWFRASSFAV
jgi:hypothetical protein